MWIASDLTGDTGNGFIVDSAVGKRDLMMHAPIVFRASAPAVGGVAGATRGFTAYRSL